MTFCLFAAAYSLAFWQDHMEHHIFVKYILVFATFFIFFFLIVFAYKLFNAFLLEIHIAHLPESIAEKVLKHNNEYNSSENIRNISGRLEIWKYTIKGIWKDPAILVRGCLNTRAFFKDIIFVHAHNSWLEVILNLGLPGLVFALYITWLVMKNAFTLIFLRKSTYSQKLVCIFTVCLMATQLTEPFLFFQLLPYNFTNVIFMLCTGYLVSWGETKPWSES